MKKVNIQMASMWIVSVLPSVTVAFFYDKLPRNIVVHIGINGGLRYGDKRVLWLLSIISILIAVLFVIFRKKNNAKGFNNEYYAVGLSSVTFLLGITIITILNGLGMDILPLSNVICFCVAILFAVIGSLIKNSSYGFRNRWTKRNSLVLKKTQMFGGSLILWGAFIQAVGSIFLTDLKLFILIVSVVIIDGVLPNIMSYIWYKRYHHK